MRLMFVHYLFEDRGSAQDIHNFAVAARELGHEVAIYGRPKGSSPFNYSMDLESADAVAFIFEWTTDLQEVDCLDWVRLATRSQTRFSSPPIIRCAPMSGLISSTPIPPSGKSPSAPTERSTRCTTLATTGFDGAR